MLKIKDASGKLIATLDDQDDAPQILGKPVDEELEEVKEKEEDDDVSN